MTLCGFCLAGDNSNAHLVEEASTEMAREAAVEDSFADDDEEGWEAMEDLASPQAPVEAAADAAMAEGDDTEGWEEPEDLASTEAADGAGPDAAMAEGDDTEGWEQPEDMAPAEAAADAAVPEDGAAAQEATPSTDGEDEAAAEGEPGAAADTHQVGFIEHSMMLVTWGFQVA